MEMPPRQSWARSSAAQGTENPTLRRTEPLPPLCKGGKKKAHLYKVTGLALNSARLKAPFKGAALRFQWSCFAIQVLLLQVEKEKLTQCSPEVSWLLPFPPSLEGLVLVGTHWGTAGTGIIISTCTIAVSTGISPASGTWAAHSSTFESSLYPKKIPTAVSWFISMLDEGELEQQQNHVRVDFSACSKAQVKQALLQPCGKTA